MMMMMMEQEHDCFVCLYLFNSIVLVLFWNIATTKVVGIDGATSSDLQQGWHRQSKKLVDGVAAAWTSFLILLVVNKKLKSMDSG